MARRRGYFITFEGGEGAGKSTQIRLLVAWLKRKRIPYVLTREPGGTRAGHAIRRVVLDPKFKGLSSRSELFLYLADRAEHVREVIGPALAAGKVVISDRFGDSSTVYQGICRGFGVPWVEALNRFATDNLLPDLVFLLDLPESEARRRLGSRRGLDRIEQEKRAFHQKVRKGFLQIARRSPKRFAVLNSARPPAEIHETIREILEKRLC